jgi:hypothetical protein
MTESTQYHAYTDGTDTIIGTTAEEALAVYRLENKDCCTDSMDFYQMRDDDRLQIVNPHGNGGKQSKTVREWIDEQITSQHCRKPDGSFTRLLCSTEY